MGGCGEKQIEDSKKQLDNKQTGNNEFLLLIEREIFKKEKYLRIFTTDSIK